MSTFLTRAALTPLVVLDRIGNAEITAKLGLRDPWLRIVKAGARTSFRVVREAAERLPSPIRLPRNAPPKRPGFDLTPTEDQALLRDTAKKFAADVLRPAANAADTATAPQADVLLRGHELALAALSVPERLGGIAEARSPMASVLVAEELARGDLGLALALLAPIGVVNALVDWGTAEQQLRWLPRFTGDTFVPASVALLEPHAGFDPMQLRAGAVRCAGGWKLYGAKALVPLAEQAELILVAAEVLGRGPQLFVVERHASGLEISPTPAMGARAAATCRLDLHGVRVRDDAMLEAYEHGKLVDGARVMWSALAVGVAQAVLDYVVPYCNERITFGEPITHRQSIAFAIANIAIELDAMRLATWRAASLGDRGAPFAREAALARRFCATRGMQIGNDGVQLLGGHGFVKEHPVERWYRDLRAIAVMEGALFA